MSTSNRRAEILQQEDAAGGTAESHGTQVNHMTYEDNVTRPEMALNLSEILDMAGSMTDEDFLSWNIPEENGVTRTGSE